MPTIDVSQYKNHTFDYSTSYFRIKAYSKNNNIFLSK